MVYGMVGGLGFNYLYVKGVLKVFLDCVGCLGCDEGCVLCVGYFFVLN